MSQLSIPIQPKFPSHAAARPMLARDADSVYWMSRYVERAEHVARLLLVNANLLIDVGDLAPTLQQRQWHSVFTVMRMDVPPELASLPAEGLGPKVAQYMSFNRDNPNSILSSVSRARENARA